MYLKSFEKYKLKMIYILITFLIIINSVRSNHLRIDNKIMDYFKSDTVKSFYDIWHQHKELLENALVSVFDKTVPSNEVNVYMGKKEDHFNIAHGFHITDGFADLLLLNLDVTMIPNFQRHAFTLELSNNVVRIDVELSPIVIKADYLLFRNRSDYPKYTQYQELSPFHCEDIKPQGKFDIMAENCRMVGIAISSLLGSSLHVGHASFKISDCKFTFTLAKTVLIEDSSTSLLVYKYGPQLENLLSGHLVDEMRSKVQAALFSTINTTIIFGPKLCSFRKAQRQIFEETNIFMRRLINVINVITTAQNGGIFKINDKLIIWNDVAYLQNVSDSHYKNNNIATDTAVLLTDLTVSGLDTAYSSHTGGPYNYIDTKIVEDIRFHNLHVQGKIYCANATKKGFRKFFIEIKDFTVSLKINLKFLQENKMKKYKIPLRVFKIDYLGWRDVDYNNLNKLVSKSFVIAYLIQEVPQYIVKYIYNVLPRATEIANSDIDDDYLKLNNTNPLKHITIKDSNVNEMNGNITTKIIENIHQTNDTEKDRIIINKNRVKSEVLHQFRNATMEVCTNSNTIETLTLKPTINSGNENKHF